MRKHWDNRADQVSRIATFLRLANQGSARFNIGRNVCNVDPYASCAIGLLFEGDGIVEVFCIFAIYSDKG